MIKYFKNLIYNLFSDPLPPEIKYIDRFVEVPKIERVEVPKYIEVEKIVEKIVETPIEKIIEVEKIVEKIVYVDKIVYKEVFIEKPIFVKERPESFGPEKLKLIEACKEDLKKYQESLNGGVL